MTSVTARNDNSATSSSSSASATSTALTANDDRDLRVPCFCEENVWRLAYRKLHSAPMSDASSSHAQSKGESKSQYFVVFVSNPSKCVCYFQQRANPDPLTPVFWDYHVLLFEQRPSQEKNDDQATLVWDVDSYLSYPCPLVEYLDESFPSNDNDHEMSRNNGHERQRQLERILPCFRVVPAEIFLEKFSSDRSHMWDAVKKEWRATPPVYDAIMPRGIKKSNLAVYINMTSHQNDEIFGSVLNQEQLRERFLQ